MLRTVFRSLPLMVALICTFFVARAQTHDTILVDFGDTNNASPFPWNNLTDFQQGSLTNLSTSSGQSSGFGLAVVKSFVHYNFSGTTQPDPAPGFPASATYDNFYGRQNQPGEDTAAIRFSGLNPYKPHEFDIFASRMDAGDNRETQYIIIGQDTTIVYLDAANNESNIAQATNVFPAVNGTITIIMTWGSNNNNPSRFFYLGAIKMIFPRDIEIAVDVNAFLEGPFNVSAMTPILPSIPLEQPYSTAPWHYSGNESVSEIPGNNIVDWVLLELRQAPSAVEATTAQRIGMQAAFIKSNGSITSTDGNSLPLFTGWPQPGLFAGIWHRNHLQVLSSTSLQELNGVFNYDFSTAVTQAFGERQKEIAPGIWSMVAGDADADGYLSMADRTDVWNLQAGRQGYLQADFNLDGQVNNIDKNDFWFPNYSSGFWTIPSIDTILVDFGGESHSSPFPWNNVTDPISGSLSNLINSAGLTTAIGIDVVDAFQGINFSGTLSTPPALEIPGNASYDSFFGELSNNLGSVEITNLNPGKLYTFQLYASRMEANDNRQTRYVALGSYSDTTYLDIANNTGNIAVIENIQPGANGIIRIDVSQGPENNNGNAFFYLGVLKMIYESEAPLQPSLTLVSPNGGEVFQAGSEQVIQWNAVNLANDIVVEFSVNSGNDWTAIDTVPSYQQFLTWTVPLLNSENCLVRLTSGFYSDISDAAFAISNLVYNCRFVVLGSSTAAGVGPSVPDSAWVNRLEAALQEVDVNYEVINLAVSGYTTYQILPDGFEIPPGVNETVDEERNITAALAYEPLGIFINLPSNDANKYYTVEQQLANFDTVINLALAQGVSVWITTPQPRNFSDPAQIQLQLDMLDTIPQVYSEAVIDFWTGVADEDGWILIQYDSGDGIHLTDAAHAILFERVWQKQPANIQCEPFTPDRNNQPASLFRAKSENKSFEQ